MRKPTITAIIGLGCLVTAACQGNAAAPRDGTVVTGNWNGTHLSLTLDDRGGTTEYDCAHGGLSEPLRVDAAGRFDVTGVHVRERGGPVREDEAVDSVPARYTGRLVGGVLTMSVAVGKDTLGPFTLRRDAPMQLFKCL